MTTMVVYNSNVLLVMCTFTAEIEVLSEFVV